MKQFNIGDKVWTGTYTRSERSIVCPDCLGTKKVIVILGGIEYSVDCGGCYPGGLEPPTGMIRQYDYMAVVEPHIIQQVSAEMKWGVVEYEYRWEYGRGSTLGVFETEGEALAAAEAEREAYQADENKRLMAKTNNKKSYAWNASYHRKEAERATHDLEYHTSKAIVMEKKSEAKK